MSWKKISALVLLLLGLIAVIGLVNHKEKNSGAAEDILLDFPAAKIEKIELRQKDMKFVFARNGALWVLQEPLAARADKVALASILEDFCPLRYDRLVEENARDLKNYGLDDPEITLMFFSKGLAAPARTILLGMRNGLDSSSYAKLAGSGKVVLLAAYKRNALEKNLLAFREKIILPLDCPAVTAMAYKYQNTAFRFVKNGDQWFMEKPLFSLVQEDKISEILSAASALEAKAFVAAANSDSDPGFNLKSPLLEVEFKSAAGFSKIAVGRKGGRFFAQVDGWGEIYEIDNDFCTRFSTASSFFREKKIAVFYAFAARELRYQRGAFGFAIKKNALNAWEWIEPRLKIKLDEEKINRLLTALADCEASEFIDNPRGTPAPVITVKLLVEDPQKRDRLKNIEMDFTAPAAGMVCVSNPALPYWFKVNEAILGKLPVKITDISEAAAQNDIPEKVDF